MVHSRWLILAALLATWGLGLMSSQQTAPQFPCVLEVTAAASYVCVSPAAFMGPTGAAGANGAPGPQGPQGIPGPSGVGPAGQACATTAGIPAGSAVIQIPLPGGLCLPAQIVIGPPTAAKNNNLLLTPPPCRNYVGGGGLPCIWVQVAANDGQSTAGVIMGLPQAVFN